MRLAAPGLGAMLSPCPPPPWLRAGKDPRPPHAGCPRVGSGAADGCAVPKEAVRPPQSAAAWLRVAVICAGPPRAVGWILLGLEAIMGSPGGG